MKSKLGTGKAELPRVGEVGLTPRQREEEEWADVRPTREVEQEVLDILDAK